MEMVVGITTAPRLGQSHLSICISSLQLAGFNDVRVYAEPESDLRGCDDVQVIQRERRFGAWHNWLAMCRELLTTDAEIIITVQDDCLVSSVARQRLEQHWPAKTGDVAFVSGYAPQHYQKRYVVMNGVRHPQGYFPDVRSAQRYVARKKTRGLHVEEAMVQAPIHRVAVKSLWGACFLAFPRRSLEKIIDHRIAESWRGARKPGRVAPPPDRIANVDTAIGKIANALKLQMWWLFPSICQHVGGQSTLAHGGLGGRRSSLYVESDLPASPSDKRQRVATRPKPCRYMGEESRRIVCPTCAGHVELRVYGCELFGEATIAKPMPDLGCCATCEDYYAE